MNKGKLLLAFRSRNVSTNKINIDLAMNHEMNDYEFMAIIEAMRKFIDVYEEEPNENQKYYSVDRA